MIYQNKRGTFLWQIYRNSSELVSVARSKLWFGYSPAGGLVRFAAPAPLRRLLQATAAVDRSALNGQISLLMDRLSRAWKGHRNKLIPISAVLLSIGVLYPFETLGSQQSGPGANKAAPFKQTYHLGPLDKVRLMVFEWRPSRDEIFAWSALNADYTIGPSGDLTLPLIGEVPAAGLSTTELAEQIGVSLRVHMGLAKAPDTSVEVVQFRPFYVIGEVEKPGEYDYRPNLTVLQALSVSGGLRRPPNTDGMRLSRDVINSQGDIALLAGERDSLLIRKTRLQSEIAGRETISLPAELSGQLGAQRIFDQERLIFTTRETAFQTQKAAHRQLKEYLQRQVESLDRQLVTQKTQTDLMRKELGTIEKLSRKGLATAPRKLALERNVAELEGAELRLEDSLMRARQEISRTEIALNELENNRTSEITNELFQTQVRLNQIEKRTETSKQLIYEAEVLAPRLISSQSTQNVLRPVYRIVRNLDGRTIEMDALETDMLLPGDSLKVLTEESQLPKASPTQPQSSSFVPNHDPATPSDEKSQNEKKTAYSDWVEPVAAVTQQ